MQVHLVKEISPAIKFIEVRFSIKKGLTTQMKTKKYMLSFSLIE